VYPFSGPVTHPAKRNSITAGKKMFFMVPHRDLVAAGIFAYGLS